MDKQRAWLKAKRKRRLRILAVILSFCVLFYTYPDILATFSVFAAAWQEQPETSNPSANALNKRCGIIEKDRRKPVLSYVHTYYTVTFSS